MAHRTTIRIHYPLPALALREPGEPFTLVLRTDLDWDADVAPAEVSADGTRFDFPLVLESTFRYWKPVLRRGGEDGEIVWSQGENYLVLEDDPAERDVYPYFFAEGTCSVCALQRTPTGEHERNHPLRVFLPPGYTENTLATYPVLYMQDGQNLFFAQEAFGGQHWMIEETLRVLDSMNLVQKAIVVGIYPLDRMVDYTRPGYLEYGRYLVEEVKPWVDATYRTRRGPESTVVMGSSLGGVVSFFLAWEWPQVFGNAACLSSTFGYQDDLHERVESEMKRDVKFYLDSGWPRDNYEPTRAMRNALRGSGYREGENLFYLAFPRAQHNEQAWSMRAHIPFLFFFGG